MAETRRLHALPSMSDDADYPVTLKGPGKAEPDHPLWGTLRERMDWLSLVTRNFRDGLDLLEADRAALVSLRARNHDGKGRKFTEN